MTWTELSVAIPHHDAVGHGVHADATDHVDADARGLGAPDRRAVLRTIGMLGGRALLGRTLDARDDAAGSHVVVLSAGAWRRYFQADPAIVGRTIALKTLGPEAGFLDGTPLTIVGVMDPSFDFPLPRGLLDADSDDSPVRRWPVGSVIARLRTACRPRPRPTKPTPSVKRCVPSRRPDRCRSRCPPGVRRFDVGGGQRATRRVEPAGAARAGDRGRRRAADRLRQRREPAAGARHARAARDRGPAGDRRQPRTRRAPADRGEPRPCRGRRRCSARRWRSAASAGARVRRHRMRRAPFKFRSAARCCRG